MLQLESFLEQLFSTTIVVHHDDQILSLPCPNLWWETTLMSSAILLPMLYPKESHLITYNISWHNPLSILYLWRETRNTVYCFLQDPQNLSTLAPLLLYLGCAPLNTCSLLTPATCSRHTHS